MSLSAFESIVVAQVPCLMVVSEALADDLSSLGALARTSRVAWRQLQLDVFFERAVRVRFAARAFRWAASTAWRTLLRSAMLALALADAPATRTAAPPFSRGECDGAARAIVHSAPYAALCVRPALLRAWARRVGKFAATFYGRDAERLFAEPSFELHDALFFAVLSVSGLLAGLLPLDAVQFHNFIANCTSLHGINNWIVPAVGDARAKLVDAAVCSLAAFSTINCSHPVPLPQLPLWPDPAGLPAQPVVSLSPLELADVLTRAWGNDGLLSMYFYPSLETDPVGEGRLTFSTFDRDVFERDVKAVTALWRKTRAAVLERHLPAHDQLIALGGECRDSVGHSRYIGFLDMTTRNVVLLKSYQQSNDPDGPPCWVYRGSLFSWGLGGRWSLTGFVGTHSGPFLLLPKTDVTVELLNRLALDAPG